MRVRTRRSDSSITLFEVTPAQSTATGWTYRFGNCHSILRQLRNGRFLGIVVERKSESLRTDSICSRSVLSEPCPVDERNLE
jgi:hypothetical protein